MNLWGDREAGDFERDKPLLNGCGEGGCEHPPYLWRAGRVVLEPPVGDFGHSFASSHDLSSAISAGDSRSPGGMYPKSTSTRIGCD